MDCRHVPCMLKRASIEERHTQTRQDIFETVSSYVIRYYADNTSQASMDQLQNQLKCCGVYMDSDYIPKAPETCLDQNRVTYTRRIPYEHSGFFIDSDQWTDCWWRH
ncbi:hypothetical protein CLF_103140 [Clonorchis sinensis]|uniref:Uncharacterized protein n=1 Tax=Clonorchis sinensis TaxID=79923 RepID=G7Y951_CLOSI|nr:hypothetical protein CLF_103140 [Clonorchis sinensis]